MLDSQAPRRTARENTCVPAEVLQAMARAGKLPGVTEATARCVRRSGRGRGRPHEPAEAIAYRAPIPRGY